MRRLSIGISLAMLTLPVVALASWAEPACDPSADPTTCNVSAPLNVSSVNQTKSGGLTIGGALTVNASGSFTANGASTFGSTVTVNGTGITINAPLIINNGFSVGTSGTSTINNALTLSGTSSFTYSGANTGFSLTANSIDDSEVSDTLTASIFKGTGSSSNAVDLATAEVAGTLPSSAVADVWVNTTGDSMTGQLIIAPTAAQRAIAITPFSTQEGIYVSGSTGQALVALFPTGTGGSIYSSIPAGSSSGVLKAISATATAGSYPVDVSSTGSATRTVNISNVATSGYGVYSSATGTGSIGVAGVGQAYGISGASSAGMGGLFVSTVANGTALEADSPITGTSAKAVYGKGANGYGGYFTSSGSSSTAVYAENTNTTAGITKYGIQALATTPAGVGIFATSDYGIAGKFQANSGGTGIEVDAAGGTTGIDIDTTGGTVGMNINTAGATGLDITVDDYYSAVEANNGEIHSTSGYRGGQFYANENAGGGIYPNVDPNYVFAKSLGGSSSDAVTDAIYDGNAIWVARGGFTPSYLQQRGLSDGRSLNEYTNSASWLDNGVAVLADDQIYFFSDSADYDVINRLDGTTTAGTLSSSFTIYSAAYDGEDIWFGSSATVREFANLSTLSTRLSGTGNIVDILYADGYIWAVDSTNDYVRKILPDAPYTATTINVGDNPQAAIYDGQFIWVANYGGNSLTRINTEDSSLATYSVSSYGTGPQALAYDGANIWIGYYSSGVGVFNIATESLTKENDMAGAEVEHLVFDGTYIWAVTNDRYLFKIPSGIGYGETSGGITDGVLMYNTSGAVRCLYISGTTVTASSSLTNCQ